MDKIKTQKRNSTTITSVSVSPEFMRLIEEYHLSPTEAFRRGVAVMLHDLDVPRYQTPLNNSRSEYVQEFLKQVETDEKLAKQFEEIETFKKLAKHIEKFKSNVDKLKEDIDNARMIFYNTTTQ